MRKKNSQHRKHKHELHGSLMDSVGHGSFVLLHGEHMGLWHVQVRFYCNAMPWVDCTALRYHCAKLPDVDLCPEAFADGRFPPGCTARDFVKADGARAPQVPKLFSGQIMQHKIVSCLRGLQSRRLSSFCNSMGPAAHCWHMDLAWSRHCVHTVHHSGSLRVMCPAQCSNQRKSRRAITCRRVLRTGATRRPFSCWKAWRCMGRTGQR